MKINVHYGVLLFMLLCTEGSAQIVELDNSFNTEGYVLASFGGGSSYISDVLIQPDGKIVTIGNSATGSVNVLAIARFMPDGPLDLSFGNGGYVTTESNTFGLGCYGAIQQDGKIIVAGTSISGNNLFTILRYNDDGSLDNTFGSSGQVTTDIIPGGSSGEGIRALIVQPDGKIMVAGNSATAEEADLTLVRYLSDGTLDNTFGSGGILVHAISPLSDFANDIVLLADGHYLVAGSAVIGVLPNTTSRIFLAKFDQEGVIVESYGENGVVVHQMNLEPAGVTKIQVQPDSKILAVGYVQAHAAQFRFTAEGELDLDFGSNGVVYTNFQTINSISRSVVVQPDGKFIVAIEVLDFDNDLDITMIRYMTDGSLDETFGNNGVMTTDIGARHDIANAVSLQDDGKILVAGYSFQSGIPAEGIILRYLNDLDVGIVGSFRQGVMTLVLPNPIIDRATLKFTLLQKENLSLDIQDINGRLINSIFRNVDKIEGEHQQIIDLSGYASGMYSLVLRSAYGTTHIKVVKE